MAGSPEAAPVYSESCDDPRGGDVPLSPRIANRNVTSEFRHPPGTSGKDPSRAAGEAHHPHGPRPLRRSPRSWLRKLSLRPGLRLAPPLFALLLTACASTPPTTFDLDPSVQFAHTRGSHGQLAVNEPTASLPLESQRIVVRTSAGTIAYLKGAQWAANLPNLVQDRLIGGFEKANLLRAVGRPGLLANRNLHTDIQHFEVDLGSQKAIIEIYARLVANDGRVVADKMFSATAPAANDHPAVIAAALSKAFAQAVHDIVIWAAPRV